MEEVSAGTIRAAITKFHKEKVLGCWEAHERGFANRYPEFSLAADRLKAAHIRVDQMGRMIFEPAFVLNLLRKVEVMESRIRDLENAQGDPGPAEEQDPE